MMSLWRWSLVGVLTGVVVACSAGKTTTSDSTAAAEPKATSEAATGAASVTGARIAVAHAGPAGEWQMPAGDYANSRYSELSSITPQNAANLKVAWAFCRRSRHRMPRT